MTRRLTPLIEDPETEASVRDVLQAGREQGVADYDFEAGLARHMAVIQAGLPMPDWAKGLETAGAGGGAATTTAAATGAGASGALGGMVWLVVPAVTAAVVAAAMWASQAEPAAPSAGSQAPAVGMRPVAPSASSAPTAVQAESPVVPAPALAPTVRAAAPTEPESVLPSEAAEAAPAVRVRGSRASAAPGKARVTSAAPVTSSGSALDGRSSSRSSGADLFAKARPAATDVEPVAPAPSEQPVREVQARDEASAEPAPKPVARIDDARLEREMGMLAVAQRVLHTDPMRTLSLVRQSAREFGDTMFAPERGQLELLALVKLGKLDDAKRLARPYLARYPNGPFSDRVRRALASGRVER